MTVHELTGPYIADGKLVIQGGRAFVAWKPPGSRRNVLYEVDLATWALIEPPIGPVPGAYYVDGGCALAFALDGELLMLSFCSPNPATGGDARPVIWQTGIHVAPAMTEQRVRDIGYERMVDAGSGVSQVVASRTKAAILLALAAAGAALE